MAYRDLLLTALTYPDATPDRAIRSGVALAKRLGGDLTLLTVRVDIPAIRNTLANALVHLDEIAEQEEARSAATAQLESVCARIAADAAGSAVCTQSVIARLFGSGRPVLVYPEGTEIAPADGFGTVAIAWDGSARAARAVADALPLLHRAQSVRIFVAIGESARAVEGAAQDLVRHLRAHGIAAKVNERVAHGQPIGHRLADYVAETRPNLLVMGAFGHARLREFILGGATQAVLEAPPCPVLMSH